MKKVLIISFYFPPLQNIGARRPFGLAKYLPRFGWEPIVLTIKLPGKPPDGIRVIETDYKDVLSEWKSRLRFNAQKGLHEQVNIKETKNFDYSTWKSKAIKFVKEIIAFPDEFIGWYRYGLDAASELLEREHIDAIISTSYPVTAHLIASKLKQKYSIPWVADFRDLWTQNHYVTKYGLIRFFERRMEFKTLFDANVLVTANPLADVLRVLHKNKEIFCITNGYDVDDFHDTTAKLTDKFTITYTGRLYNGKRDPAMLFKVVQQLIAEKRIEGNLVEIRFFGPKEQWLLDEIDKYNLKGVVSVNDFISREKAIEIQKESQILLLLLWNNKDEDGIYPGKVFEYLGAKRPIIAIGRRGSVVQRLLDETNSGKFAEDANTLERLLLDYYAEYIEYGEIKCHSNENINNYIYGIISKKYSEILNKLIVQ
jgi:hypothetical protein